MTALTKRHQVRELVSSATRKRYDVMNLINRCDSSFFQTTLAQWMLLNIKCTDPSPIVPILLIVVRSPVVFVILLVPQCLMLLTIGLMRKVRTIWISTRLHWFMWHRPSSFYCSKKSPQDCSKWTIILYGFRLIISYHTIDKITIGHAWSHLVNCY